jgi:hypothetical protein
MKYKNKTIFTFIILILMIPSVVRDDNIIKRMNTNDINVSLSISVENTVLWNITSNFDNQSQHFEDVVVVGSFIYACGSEKDLEKDKSNLLLVKFDGDGNVIWKGGWEDPEYSAEGRRIWSDNTSIYVAGYSYFNGLLVKWDLDGNYKWHVNRLQDYHGASFNAIDGNDENVFVIADGENGANRNDLYLFKFDKDGNEIWNRTWGWDQNEDFRDIFVKNDSIYIMGNIMYIGGNTDSYILEWDSNGNLIRIYNETDNYIRPNGLLKDDFIYYSSDDKIFEFNIIDFITINYTLPYSFFPRSIKKQGNNILVSGGTRGGSLVMANIYNMSNLMFAYEFYYEDDPLLGEIDIYTVSSDVFNDSVVSVGHVIFDYLTYDYFLCK